MNRSVFLFGVPLITLALIGGGLVSASLYSWEQTARATSQPTAAPIADRASPTPPTSTAEETTQASSTSTPTGVKPTPSSASQTTTGQAVYAQLCDPCHPGGGAGLGPALSGPDFEATYAGDAALVAFIRQGGTGMPGFPEGRISEAELQDLIAFIRSLSMGVAEATPTEVAVAGQLTWTGSYARDIQPTFDEYCVRCHGGTLAENGLRLDAYEGVMKGTHGGPVVSPELASGSTLVWVIQGLTAPELRMPHAERLLSPNRIQNIILWIDAGAPDD